ARPADDPRVGRATRAGAGARPVRPGARHQGHGRADQPVISARSVQTLAKTSAATSQNVVSASASGVSIRAGAAPPPNVGPPAPPEMSAFAAVNGKYLNTSWMSA